jgi:hypothetical protein
VVLTIIETAYIPHSSQSIAGHERAKPELTRGFNNYRYRAYLIVVIA